VTVLAWLLLALCVIGPGVGLFVTRPRPTRCECGAFKLPRAERCFDCTNKELAAILPPPERPTR
jgi:hypothetical protein